MVKVGIIIFHIEKNQYLYIVILLRFLICYYLHGDFMKKFVMSVSLLCTISLQAMEIEEKGQPRIIKRLTVLAAEKLWLLVDHSEIDVDTHEHLTELFKKADPLWVRKFAEKIIQTKGLEEVQHIINMLSPSTMANSQHHLMWSLIKNNVLPSSIEKEQLTHLILRGPLSCHSLKYQKEVTQFLSQYYSFSNPHSAAWLELAMGWMHAEGHTDAPLKFMFAQNIPISNKAILAAVELKEQNDMWRRLIEDQAPEDWNREDLLRDLVWETKGASSKAFACIKHLIEEKNIKVKEEAIKNMNNSIRYATDFNYNDRERMIEVRDYLQAHLDQ